MRSTVRTKSARLGAIAACVGLGILAAGTPARADQIAVAADLFQEGKKLMAEGHVTEACKAFGQSMKLDPGTGTLLNLAVCHEQEGKTATAWAEFSQVIPLARNQARADRVQLAQEHADQLAPKLSRLILTVPPESNIDGLVIRVDGSEIDDLLWNKALTEDPGSHTVEVTAKDRLPWTHTVEIGADADRQSLQIPVLELAPIEVAPVVARPDDSATLAAADAIAAARARRIIGFTLGGVGIGALGVGLAFGVVAVTAKHAASDACPQYPNPCDGGAARAASKNSDAVANATIADILVGVGVLALAGGSLLVFSAQPAKVPARSALRVAPSPLPRGAALNLGGDW